MFPYKIHHGLFLARRRATSSCNVPLLNRLIFLQKIMIKKAIIPLALLGAAGFAFFHLKGGSAPSSASGASTSGTSASPVGSGSSPQRRSQAPSSTPDTVTSTDAYQQALAEARAPDGSLPQGEPVLPAPSDQVLDDPRDQGGIIIPQSNKGIYVPGEKALLAVTSGEKSGNLTPNQNGTFPMMVIIPDGQAQLTLTYPDLPAGSKIDLYAPDGGTIDGETKLAGTLDSSSSITVAWQGNENLGYHSVAAFAGPAADEKVVRFWVGPRALAETSSAYQN